MRTIGVDSNNNLYLDSSGNIPILKDVAAVTQSCEQASQVLMGELPYAQTRGIAFFDVGFTSISKLALYESQLRAMLLSVPEVTKVVSIAWDVQETQINYEAKIQTSYSTETINGTV